MGFDLLPPPRVLLSAAVDTAASALAPSLPHPHSLEAALSSQAPMAPLHVAPPRGLPAPAPSPPFTSCSSGATGCAAPSEQVLLTPRVSARVPLLREDGSGPVATQLAPTVGSGNCAAAAAACTVPVGRAPLATAAAAAASGLTDLEWDLLVRGQLPAPPPLWPL